MSFSKMSEIMEASQTKNLPLWKVIMDDDVLERKVTEKESFSRMEKMLDAMIDAGWEFTNVEQLHEFFKAQMTADEVVNRETGEIVKFPSSTSSMSTVDFSAYCEKLREYARDYLNVEIPDPDKYWRLREDEDHS